MTLFAGKGARKAEAYQANIEIKAMNAISFTNAIKNIAYILHTTNIRQITGRLIEFNNHNLVGKCALGVISCESGLVLDEDNSTHSFEKILSAAGIPDEYTNLYFPFLDGSDWENGEHSCRISDVIISLNDGQKYDIHQIADYLHTTYIQEYKKRKISVILLESTGNRKQSWTSLAEVTNNGTLDYKITRYCAIGAIGCENKTMAIDNRIDASYTHLKGDDELIILRKAGVTAKSMNKDYRDFMSISAIKAIAEKEAYALGSPMPLVEFITTLNDTCRWPFAKIGKELELLEDNHIIEYKEV